MWRTGVVLLGMLAVSVAQDNCECVLYNYCKGTQHENICESLYEVCCGREEERKEEEPANTCGLQGQSDESPRDPVDYKINVPGTEDSNTRTGEFPWMVAVMKASKPEGLEFLCGGSIIYSNVILTTAHTVSGLSADQLSVKAGIWNTTSVQEMSSHQDRQVSRVIVHPNYDRKKVENDVALLVLDRPVTASTNVVPVCLPSADTALNMSSCVATGWGTDNFGKKNTIYNVLRKVSLPIVDRETCETRLRQTPRLGADYNLHSSFICAGDGQSDTCKGDGGGPLMCATLANPRQFVQVGITAWGIGCGEGTPGVYSSVEAALTWIKGAVPSSSVSTSL